MTSDDPAVSRRHRRAGPLSALALAAVVAVVLTAALALGRYALPADDDWMRAGRWGPDAAGHGHAGLSWWRYVYGFVYLHWQGRWASCGIEAAVLPAVDPTRLYPLLLGGVWAADLACLTVVCRWFTRGRPWQQTAAATAVAAAMLWAGVPAAGESVYWFTGTLENTTAVLLAAALLAATAAAGERPRPGTAAALAAAAVGVCGFHELYGGALCLALAVGGVANRRRAGRWTWAAVLAGATVGLAVVVLAPGNRHRAVHDATAHARPLAFALRLSAKLLWHDGPRWAADPKLLAASAWVACSPWVTTAGPAGRRLRWAVPAAGAVAVAVGFVVPCYAFGHVPPARTVAGDWLMFVAAWLLAVWAWSSAAVRRPGLASAAAFALALSLVGTGNLRRAAADLRGPARPWHAAQARRFAALRRAAVDHAPVSVPPLPRAPQLFLSGETSADPADWRNFGLADYFGTGRLTLAPAAGAGVSCPTGRPGSTRGRRTCPGWPRSPAGSTAARPAPGPGRPWRARSATTRSSSRLPAGPRPTRCSRRSTFIAPVPARRGPPAAPLDGVLVGRELQARHDRLVVVAAGRRRRRPG